MQSVRYLLGVLTGLERLGLVFPEDMHPRDMMSVLLTITDEFIGGSEAFGSSLKKLYLGGFDLDCVTKHSIVNTFQDRLPLLENPDRVTEDEAWYAIFEDEKLPGLNGEWADPTVMSLDHWPDDYPSLTDALMGSVKDALHPGLICL